MLLLGHRGARRCAPENTIAAFELALAHGCDGFEFDVRLTADACAVICHDDRLARRAIAANTHAELLVRDPALPTLDEVLARFAQHAYLYIELKVVGLERRLLSALTEHAPERGYVVASFLSEVLEAVYALDATVPLGYICDRKKLLPRWRELPVACVMPHHKLASREVVEQLRHAGKQVFVWTVNDRRRMLQMAELGVDAVLSDDTRLLCETLGARSRALR